MVSAVTGGGRVVVEADLGQGQQGGAGLDGIGLTAQRGGAVDAATRGGADDLVTAGVDDAHLPAVHPEALQDRKSTRLNSSHVAISYAVFCLKKKNKTTPSLHDP